MTEESGSGDVTPRLGPRPLDRPAVDPHQASVFRRPDGVASAFAARPPDAAANGSVRVAPPPPEALATAFGRPAGAEDVLLQRAPGVADALVDPAGTWEGTGDPWRDPRAGAALGPPAVDAGADGDAAAHR